MLQHYDGAKVLDPAGNVIGTVERTYDDDTGVARYVEVKFGSIFSKHRLVPLDEAQIGDDGLTVPYSQAMVEDAPDASSVKETLDGDTLDQARAYYAQLRSSSIPASKAVAAGKASENQDQ
jgi:hypothetical protein